MKNRLMILPILMLTIFFSCKKEKDEDAIVKEKIEIVIPQQYIDTLKGLGMNVFEGSNPPNVEGIYLLDSLILINSNIPGFIVGTAFSDAKINLYNQNTTNFSLTVEQKTSGSLSTSENSVVTGDGDNFTIWGNLTTSNNGDTAIIATIISGQIADDGIKNLDYALINVDYIFNGSNQFLLEGQARFIKDQNDFCPRVDNFDLLLEGNYSEKFTNIFSIQEFK